MTTLRNKLAETLVQSWKANSGFTGVNRIIIYPASMGSESCKAVQQALKDHYTAAGNTTMKVLRVKPDGEYVPNANDIIINFGNKVTPNWLGSVKGFLFNSIAGVNKSIDKLATFQALHGTEGVNTLEFTTDQEIAKSWLDHGKVYCRTLTRASGGEGIVVANNEREMVRAPLYTRGINVAKEYRVHVFNGKVIDLVQKRRRVAEDGEIQEHNEDVRNIDGGWVFCRENVSIPDSVKEMCIKATTKLGLDFAAIDLLKSSSGRFYICETNTCCGKEGTTLENYKQAILELVEECNEI